jgi:hypothetical protein
VGVWHIEFTRDSIRKIVHKRAESRVVSEPVTPVSVVGVFALHDTVVTIAGDVMRSLLDVDFTPLLGRPMSCFHPERNMTGVERRGATVKFSFTPLAADCGFYGHGHYWGDSVTGVWAEDLWVSASGAGRFVMRRLSRP